jgi:hypothetical protein
VYVPAGSEVQFVIAQSPQTATAGGTAAPAAATNTVPAQPSATATNTVPAQPPATATSTVPAQPSATATSTVPAQPSATASTPGSSTVVYENIQYQLQNCQREAPHIICQVQITNLGGADAYLVGGQGTYYFDQAGNKVGASNRAIANCAGWGRCQLPPGIAMAGRFEFLDVQGHATQLVRLQIVQSAKAVAQFTQVPVN